MMSIARSGGDLIFVVGASRSGTTMLCRILGLHSLIFGMQEIHFFGDIWDVEEPDTPWSTDRATAEVALMLARQARDIWGDGPTEQERAEARRLVEASPDLRPSTLFRHVALEHAARAGKSMAAEQTPRNVFYAPRLLELYPEARVIEVVRDPRAVLLSQRDRWKMRRLGARNVPLLEVIRTFVNYHAVTMSRLWRSAVRAGRRLDGHPRFMTVRYEDLVRNPAVTLKGICVFLGVPFEPGMFEVPQIASSTRRNDHNARGITQDALDRWRDRLPEGDRALCERLTQHEARSLGYDDVTGASVWRWPVLMHLLRFPLHAIGVLLTNPSRALAQWRAVSRVKP